MCFMALEYVGVIAPHILPQNLLMDFIAPLAFTYNIELRWVFIVLSIFTSLVAPASQVVGDDVGRDPKLKVYVAVVYLLCLVSLAIVHTYPKLFFMLLYPLSFLGFNALGFVLANLLKKKQESLTKEFKFYRSNAVPTSPNTFFWKSARDGNVVVLNPYRGIFIVGGAGAGKTYTKINPIIQQGVEFGFTGMVYDFKFPTLGRVVYNSFVNSGSIPAKKTPDGKWIGQQSLHNDRRKLWYINFKDARFSHRVNPVDPKLMHNQDLALELATILLKNLEPGWIKSKGDFFAGSAFQAFTAILWYFRKRHGHACTIPHAVKAAMMPYPLILAALNTDPDTREMIASIEVAKKEGAGQQIAGVIATLQQVLGKINTPNLAWTLTSSDFSLVLNDPENPGIVVIGNDPATQAAYGPVAALICSVIKNVINAERRLPSFYVIDELPTIFIPDLHVLPNTGRSNKIMTVLCVQDISQVVRSYGQEEANVVLSACGNQAFGQVNDLTTAEKISKIIGTREKEMRSTNRGKSLSENVSTNTGESHSIQRQALIEPHEILSLETGTFLVKLAESDDPKNHESYFLKVKPDIDETNQEHAFDHVLVKHDGTQISNDELKMIIEENFIRVKEEAEECILTDAKLACLQGLEDERKLFPDHFYVDEKTHEYKRLTSIEGDILPGVKGVRKDPETKKIVLEKGYAKPVFTEMYEAQFA